MNPKVKKIVLITGIALIAIAVGVGLYLYFNRDKEEDKDDKPRGKDKEPDSGSNPSGGSSSGGKGGSGGSGSGSGSGDENTNADPNTVVPIFNTEQELSNDFSQLKNRVLYPKRKEHGGFGYAHLRSSAEVNTNRGWWDGKTNLITTINSGTPIGKVLSKTSGLYNGYSYTWYKVRLNKPFSTFFKTYYEAYVRADVVTIKPYPKTS